MNSRGKHLVVEDLLEAIGAITEQIKVLVSAVDDLRCEVEWQSRNNDSDASSTAPNTEQSNDYSLKDGCDVLEPAASPPLLSPEGRLQAYETVLCQGPRGKWRDDWAQHDDFEMPTGRVIAVDGNLFEEVLSMRPAHIVGENCCCEDGMGAPYLLAWSTENECLLRELTEPEARQLQKLCLAHTDCGTPEMTDILPADVQLGLF